MTREEVMKSLKDSFVVPVVVLDDASKAVDTAKALYAGGIKVMEITFRTAAALDSIKAVAKSKCKIVLGAGTVLNADDAKRAVDAGCKFIVSPGFNREMVKFCVDNDIAVLPGCVTPSEIMQAIEMGLGVVKFFPANVYGGVKALKSLSGPFPNMKFIPTGGVSLDNIAEYAKEKFIYAVGGSWLCAKADIASESWDKITKICEDSRQAYLGYELAHIGINLEDGKASLKACKEFSKAFSFPVKEGNSSNFAGSAIEVMKSMYLGENGHIAIKTNSVDAAVSDLTAKGYKLNEDTIKIKDGRMTLCYLEDDIAGFAVHLIQK